MLNLDRHMKEDSKVKEKVNNFENGGGSHFLLFSSSHYLLFNSNPLNVDQFSSQWSVVGEGTKAVLG